MSDAEPSDDFGIDHLTVTPVNLAEPSDEIPDPDLTQDNVTD